jgi:hypothetical protein
VADAATIPSISLLMSRKPCSLFTWLATGRGG